MQVARIGVGVHVDVGVDVVSLRPSFFTQGLDGHVKTTRRYFDSAEVVDATISTSIPNPTLRACAVCLQFLSQASLGLIRL